MDHKNSLNAPTIFKTPNRFSNPLALNEFSYFTYQENYLCPLIFLYLKETAKTGTQ